MTFKLFNWRLMAFRASVVKGGHFYSDQACSRLRNWRFSASWGGIKAPLKPLEHYYDADRF